MILDNKIISHLVFQALEQSQQQALKHINKAIELKEDFADAYRSRGLIYLAQGKIAMANQELNLAKKYGAKNIDKTIKRFEKQLKMR